MRRAPLVDGGLRDPRRIGDPGVVDQHVELDDRLDDGLDARRGRPGRWATWWRRTAAATASSRSDGRPARNSVWVGANAAAMADPSPPAGSGDHRGSRTLITLPTCAASARGRMMEPMPPDPSFAPTQLAARAAYLLRGNDLGVMTTAAPLLYPHMWSWDAAFVSIGLAPLSVERAVVELDTLLSAQWRNGMIPHIVFANGVDGYFPGPARWATSALAANAPRTRHTSGITQPPVHAIAVQRILDHAKTRGRSTRAVAEAFLDRRWDDLVRWHRWLAEARDPELARPRHAVPRLGVRAWTTRRAGTAPTPT